MGRQGRDGGEVVTPDDARALGTVLVIDRKPYWYYRSGAPVCAAERAVVEADESWHASSLRRKVNHLLACLEVGAGA